MNTNALGRATIAGREGRRLVAYLDSKRIPTVGIGHTSAAGPPKVALGMRITAAECDAIFARDLAPVDATINAALTRPHNQGQHNSFASIGFNIGRTGFAGSSMVRRFNAGDLLGCANAFLLWNKPPELKARRQAERAQFLKASVDRATAVAKPAAAKPVQPRKAVPVPAPLPKPLPPVAAQPEANTMKAPALFAFILAFFGVTQAHAADIDFGPLVQAGVEYLIVPLVGAAATWLVGWVGVAAKKYLDQKTANLLAQNVDGVLQKAISYGAAQAQGYIGDRSLHANVDGWVASYAAKYAIDHAPQLMKQAGDIGQKIIARLGDHPDVNALKAAIQDLGAPAELHPAA